MERQNRVIDYIGRGNKFSEHEHEGVLVSHDAQIDSRVTVLLDSSQQGGAIAVPDLPRMEVVFWVQQLPRQMWGNETLEILFIHSMAWLTLFIKCSEHGKKPCR